MEPFALERYFARHEFSARYLLSSSDCDGLPMQELITEADPEVRLLWQELRLGYTESLGLPALRTEVASLYSGLTAGNILTMVPEEGIYAAMRCLLRPGDHVIATFPGYQSLYQIAETIGCEVTRWLPSETDGWRFDPAFLEDQIRPDTRLVVINFPHNPTGALPTQADYERILNSVVGSGAYLFSDEMYRLLEWDSVDRLPAAAEQYERAVSLSGMSKVFGMAGVRTGWLATRDEQLFQQIASYKDYLTICGSGPSEILALAGLRARGRIIAANLEKITRNAALAGDFFQRQAGRFAWAPPRAGTVAFARLHAPDGAGRLAEDAVRQAGVMLLPSGVYGFGDRHFRIGLGRENFPEALAAFETFLAGYA